MNRIIPLGGDALRQTAEKQEGTTISPDTEKDNLNSPDRKSPLQSILKNKFKGFLLNKTTPEEETIQSSTQRLRVDDTVAIGNSTDAENHAKGYTSGLKLPGMEETPSNKEHMLTPNSNAENKKGGLFTLIKKNLPDLSKNNQLKTNLMKYIINY